MKFLLMSNTNTFPLDPLNNKCEGGGGGHVAGSTLSKAGGVCYKGLCRSPEISCLDMAHKVSFASV